ncbi:MAG: glycosyltransferase [Bacteroidia bacterium]|jgi:glycosyltransferase involved in cell wall biosynthesis|nr:glycosyltransferase [Bacteroidia bacterium]
MDNPVLVSVVMPVFNGGAYLQKAIQSICNQTYPHFEFIIVNDGSTDNSAETIRLFNDSRIRVVTHQANKGIVAALNMGFSLAQGKYIIRMDADDIAHKQRIEKQVGYLEAHPEVGLLGTQYTCIGGRAISLPLSHSAICWQMLTSNPFVHSAVCMRKSLLIQLGDPYRLQFEYCEDLDLWMRIAQRTKLANLPDTLIRFRKHNATYQKNVAAISSKSKQLQIEHARYLMPNLSLDAIEALILLTNRYQKPPTQPEYLTALLSRVSAILQQESNMLLTEVCNNALYYHFAVSPRLYQYLRGHRQLPNWYKQPFYKGMYLTAKALLKQ